MLSVEELGEGLQPHGHITLHPTPKPRQATTEEYHHNCLITIIGRVLLIIWLKPSVTMIKLISESAPNPSELVLLIPSKLISPPHPLLCGVQLQIPATSVQPPKHLILILIPQIALFGLSEIIRFLMHQYNCASSND